MNTIVLKGMPIQKEATATSVAITPGELLEFSGGLVQAHSTAGGNAQPMFAVENDQIGDGIDDDYAADAEIKYVVGRQGDELQAILADGHNVSRGDALESAGDGTLQPHVPQAVDEYGTAIYTIYGDAIVAYAAEDVDTTGTPTATARIKIEAA